MASLNLALPRQRDRVFAALPDARRRIVGSGEMAHLVRECDWSATSLGPIDDWSETLVGAVNMVLNSPIPSTIYWGPAMVMIYNDSYRIIAGARHPASLGGSGPEIWKEVWALLQPQIDRILTDGEPTRQDAILIPIELDGRLQDFYWNYTLSGIYEDCELAGIYNTATDVTSAALTARERDALAARLEQVLDSTTDGVVSIGRDWRFTYMNEAARLANRPLTDLLGKVLWEALPRLADEVSPDFLFFHRAMDENQPGEFESFYPEPLNHWLRIQVRPASDGIVLFFSNITESKRAAEALKQSAAALAASEEELRWTISLSSQIPFTASPDGAILKFGDNVSELTGQSNQDMLGDTWATTMYPEDASAMATAWSHSLLTGEPFCMEHRVKTIAGGYHWFRTRAFARRDAEGSILRWYGLAEDINIQKRSAEELTRTTTALAASEEELRWTVKLSTQIPWTADTTGAITGFSDRWPEITGLTRQQLLGGGWANAIHPEDLADTVAAWTHCVASGDPFDAEHRFRLIDGEFHWMRGRATPRRDERGTIVKWYGTLEDIEERKKSEQALRTNEKLAAVGRLAASIAHEINNPLESVTNLLYLARSSNGLALDVAEYLAIAERELRRASVITNQTLRFHKQSTKPTFTDTAELIDSGLSVYQGRLLNSNVLVERRFRSVQPVLCFDGELRQVFNNLVGNAIDAMHPTGGRLVLRTRNATHLLTGLRGLVLTVADTGPGMSPDVQKRIFEPFFTTKGIGGTGLGLWVTQEIVMRHHGSLRLRSTQNPTMHGTVFTLFLPFDPLAQDLTS